MQTLKNILVVVDPFAVEQPAVKKAAQLATVYDARVELLICDSQAARKTRAAALLNQPKNVAATLKEKLELLAAPLQKTGIDVTSSVIFVEPLHIAVLQHAAQNHVDLVIKDTHHHSAIERTMFTNTDWHLIRDCPAPLLLTKATPWRSPPTILAALDPGHAGDKPASLDQRLLWWADSLAKHLKGSAHAAHAYIPAALMAMAISNGPPVWVPNSDELIQSELAQKRAELNALIDGFSIGLKQVHLEIGSPTDVLLAVTKRISADVLVTGAVSRSAVKRIFLGSTAEQLLERLPCDILIVKSMLVAGD